MMWRLTHVLMTLALGLSGLAVPMNVPARSPEWPTDGDLVTVNVSNAPSANSRRAYYLNGVNTSGKEAVTQARIIAERLGMNTTLGYIDCSVPAIDFVAIATSKVGDLDSELNPAADRVLAAVRADLDAGREVAIVGYSLGGAVAQNVVNKLRGRLPGAVRDSSLKRVSIVLLGAACFSADHALSDGFPRELGSVFSIGDIRDPIARWWGDIDDDWVESDLDHHSLEAYAAHLSPDRTRQFGRLVIDGSTVLLEQVVAAPSPRELVIRWRVWDMPGQESRRTVNAAVPDSWKTVEWSVSGGAAAKMVRATPMRDASWRSDEAVSEPVRHGTRGPAPAGKKVYLGRVEVDQASLVRGVEVTIRPVMNGETAAGASAKSRGGKGPN